MPDFGSFFGEGTTAQQFLIWQVLGQVFSAGMAPGLTELQKLVFSLAPTMPLDPGVAADAQVRGIIDPGTAQDAANDSGYGGEVFATMVDAARRSPDLSMILTLLNRGAVDAGESGTPDATVRGALTDMGIREEWHDALVSLRISRPTEAAIMQAWLTGQISEGEARDRWGDVGGDPDWFQTAYNASGQAPTPVEALELLNRGIIAEGGTGPGATSYDQAFLEGPWRNKWLPAFKQLRQYLPPPRTITAMFHDGQLSRSDALGYLIAQGLTADLAAAYLHPSQSSKTTTEKTLAKTDVLAMVADKLISDDDAVKALVALHYTDHDARLLLAVSKMRATISAQRSAVTRTRSLYLAGTITAADATNVLSKVGVPADQVAGVIATWKLTNAEKPRELSAAQIESAWYYQIIDTREALARLEALGYLPADARIALDVRNKAPLTPAQLAGGAAAHA